MVNNYQPEELDEKTIKTVLHEYGEDQRQLIQHSQKQQESIDSLTSQLIALEQKWDIIERSQLNDRKGYEAALKAGLREIYNAIEQQPKAVTRQIKIQLFPEHNTTEYYRVVFGRLMGWLVLVLAVTYLFSLGKQYIERNQAIKENELETFHYRKAWHYLYQRQTKTERRKMDSAWQKSWQMPE